MKSAKMNDGPGSDAVSHPRTARLATMAAQDRNLVFQNRPGSRRCGRPQPSVLEPQLLAELLTKKLISSDPENHRAVWFGEILLFSDAQRDCWRVLWDNLFKGNLPLPHARIISAWGGESTHLSYLYKRHPAWKRIIVGNGKGMFWLHIPEHILLRESA